ncbi:hypothetical protein P885DRAFT_59463 [Corynascus similis CBS 632.67]
MATPSPNRPAVIGNPSGPEPPYPLRMSGLVISGFGRGSKELGIPTANLPVDDTKTPWISSIPSGVYFGWVSLRLPPSHPDYIPTPSSSSSTSPSSSSTQQEKEQQQTLATNGQSLNSAESKPYPRGRNGFTVYPMVMSIGYNPFYKNSVRSAEVHVLHAFGADFYGAEMRLLVAGFIRDERDYSGLDALIADINFDCEVARRSLAREAWAPRGVNVEVGLPSGGKEEQDGGIKVLSGTLDCDWLIRPSELEGEKKGE